MFEKFMASYVVFIVVFAIYVYFFDDGSEKHDRNTLIIGLVGFSYLMFGILALTFEKEINSLVTKVRGNPEITVAAKNPSRSAERVAPVSGVALRKSFCVKDASDIFEVIDAIKQKDAAYLDQMILDGRAFWVTVDTRVIRSDSGIANGVVYITFKEGRYRNQSCYTFLKCVPTEEEYFANKGKMYIPDSK